MQAETRDADAKARAAEIEATLKRLTRLSERLLQLARAEGGRLRRDVVTDLRPVAQILANDMVPLAGKGRISLLMPETPVMSDLDPDAFAILFRNFVENALRHGAEGGSVEIRLAADGTFSVANDGHVLSATDLERLTNRFERAGAQSNGSGLGLAIVAAIAERIGTRLVLRSPRPGHSTGFEATIRLPVG